MAAGKGRLGMARRDDGFMEATRENNFDGDPISMSVPNPRVIKWKIVTLGEQNEL